MADINVEPTGTGEYRVTVSEPGSETTYIVTVDRSIEGSNNSALVEASFRFLLDREPKESILSSFNLSVIERYFPEYPQRIRDYL